MKTISAFIFSVGLVFTSCEKAVLHYAEMRQYYQESTVLAQTSQDSINRFSKKVDGFVNLHPLAKEDPLYPEIEQNISRARLIIRIDGEVWDDDVHIEFEFGEGTD